MLGLRQIMRLVERGNGGGEEGIEQKTRRDECGVDPSRRLMWVRFHVR
jgi:hypothetical protein